MRSRFPRMGGTSLPDPSRPGSVVIVTGASAGIGAATAELFYGRGARVLAVARRADRLAELVDRCSASPGAGQIVALQADVSDEQAPLLVAEAARDAFGTVDVLVNNAGIALHRSASDTTTEDVRRVFEVNFFAAVRLTHAVLPGMLERASGTIVNVTSVAGYLPNPRESAYGATKAALSHWSHCLNVELRSRGVHVAVVSPGPIDTEIWQIGLQSYDGRRFPPVIVAEAIADVVDRRVGHRTSPRAYGIPPALYPTMGRAFRWCLARQATRTASQEAALASVPPPSR